MSFGIDWALFTSTFVLIFVAELPDKTAFATVFLAANSNPWAVFVGAAGAFLVQSLVAILFGSALHFLPESLVHYGSAVLFLVFAVQMWRKAPEEDEAEVEAGAPPADARRVWLKACGAAFLTVFIAEWGDLTQLATATLQAKYGSPVTIFIAATLALWAVTAIGVVIGHASKHLINPHKMQKVAAVVMAAVAIYLAVKG